jgi:hypothetical protein
MNKRRTVTMNKIVEMETGGGSQEENEKKKIKVRGSKVQSSKMDTGNKRK